MVRILSALVLIAVVFTAVWFLPPLATLALALTAAGLAFLEYAALAAQMGAKVFVLPGLAATLAAAAAMALPDVPLDVVLATAVVAIGSLSVGQGHPAPERLVETAASLFPVLYLGIPLGALAAVRASAGREALLLLVAVVAISDTGQFYSGRLFGRTPLAPRISPKKTVEGAIGGLVVGTVGALAIGRWWLPDVPSALAAAMGAALVALGIIGDLFESLLKRSAGVKDSGHLIPGHGGLLDRIDSWLFAAPVYYVFLRYAVIR